METYALLIAGLSWILGSYALALFGQSAFGLLHLANYSHNEEKALRKSIMMYLAFISICLFLASWVNFAH